MLRMRSFLAVALPQLAVAASLWDGMQPGTIAFKQLGKCASGAPAYYGVIMPEKDKEPDGFFVEAMGGAICFNQASCSNWNLKTWTDIDYFLKHFVKLTNPVYIQMLKSGTPIPLALMLQLNSGFFPDSEDHPFYGRRGLYLVMCSADVFIGKHNATYAPEPIAGPGPSSECNESFTLQGQDYRGCQNSTLNGFACQKWSAQLPHSHGFVLSDDDAGDHNYCRNPGNHEDQIWCYTDNPYLRWDYCNAANSVAKPLSLFHHGGSNTGKLLQMVQDELPNLMDIQLYGASGGGVAAAAWSTIVADMWPQAQVKVLADSSLHVFPGTELFDYFWEKAQYGQGPAAQQTPMSDDEVPDFDWREADALAKELRSHAGRVKIAYVSCIDDKVVYSDRQNMAVFAGLSDVMTNLLNKSTQHVRTWAFLNSLHVCSAEGASYSYISDCNEHHQSRDNKWQDRRNPGTNVSMREFAFNFLKGKVPDETAPSRTQFWYETQEAQDAGLCCPSPVRRRRGVAGRAGDETANRQHCQWTPPPSTTVSSTTVSDQDISSAAFASQSIALCIISVIFTIQHP